MPAPPVGASKWCEDDIRRYFSSRGEYTPEQHSMQEKLVDPPPELFDLWFPGLKRSGTKQEGSPAVRVVCFPNAGNAEDMYTSEGTGVRKAVSPLLVRFFLPKKCVIFDDDDDVVVVVVLEVISFDVFVCTCVCVDDDKEEEDDDVGMVS